MGRAPDSGKKRIIGNLRIVASVMYHLLQRHDEILPPVCHQQEGMMNSVLTVLTHSNKTVVPINAPPVVPPSPSSSSSAPSSPIKKSLFNRKKTDKVAAMNASLFYDESFVNALLGQRDNYNSDILSILRFLHTDSFFESARGESPAGRVGDRPDARGGRGGCAWKTGNVPWLDRIGI